MAPASSGTVSQGPVTNMAGSAAMVHNAAMAKLRPRIDSASRWTVSSSAWRRSISSYASTSSAFEPSASAISSSRALLSSTPRATSHSRSGSRRASRSTSASPCERAARSAAVMRMARRAVLGVSPARSRMLTWPAPFVNDAVTSAARSMSTIRGAPLRGRKTAYRSPPSDRTSRWTPGRPALRPPTSSLTSPSRSSWPIPAMTVSRSWKSRVKVSSPASMAKRSKCTSGSSAPPSGDLSQKTHAPGPCGPRRSATSTAPAAAPIGMAEPALDRAGRRGKMSRRPVWAALPP